MLRKRGNRLRLRRVYGRSGYFPKQILATGGGSHMDAATRTHIETGHTRLAHYITKLANEPSLGLCAFPLCATLGPLAHVL